MKKLFLLPFFFLILTVSVVYGLGVHDLEKHVDIQVGETRTVEVAKLENSETVDLTVYSLWIPTEPPLNTLLKQSDNGSVNTDSMEYVKLKEITVNYAIRYWRVTFKLSAPILENIPKQNATAIIGVNNQTIGEEYIRTGTFQEKIENFYDQPLQVGDKLQLYVKISNSTCKAHVKDFMLYDMVHRVEAIELVELGVGETKSVNVKVTATETLGTYKGVIQFEARKANTGSGSPVETGGSARATFNIISVDNGDNGNGDNSVMVTPLFESPMFYGAVCGISVVAFGAFYFLRRRKALPAIRKEKPITIPKKIPLMPSGLVTTKPLTGSETNCPRCDAPLEGQLKCRYCGYPD